MVIDDYEWKNIKPIDIGFWANMREGWELFGTSTFLRENIVTLYRKRKHDEDAPKSHTT